MNEESIVAYPLNGITYDATDAQTYLCTRTSGVYSSENHFKLGEVTRDRQITIGSGIAWMKISEFGGIVFAVTEPVAVQVPGAGDTDRTDLIVLRYDGNRNTREVACKTNSNSVQQYDGIFELALYRIDIPHNTTQITSSHIHDVRSTPLCGVMKDGVTGIPVETLVDNFESRLKDLLGDIDKQGKAGIKALNDDAAIALSAFQREGETAIGTINSNASDAITDFQKLYVKELNTFREEADDQLDDNLTNNSILITGFDAAYKKAIDDANAQFEATNKNGQEIVQELTQKNTAFGQDIDTFKSNAQNSLGTFQSSGSYLINKFERDSQKALDDFEEDVANVAAGTDAMLQTAFNQSGKVGQVAFSDELPLVITGGFAKKIYYTDQENVFTVPFSSIEQKEQLREWIAKNRSITLRLFSAKQSGEETSFAEWDAVIDFINGNGGTFEDVFDVNKQCYDFRFQFMEGEDTTSRLVYFTGLFDDLKTAVLYFPIDGYGSSGTLTFI